MINGSVKAGDDSVGSDWPRAYRTTAPGPAGGATSSVALAPSGNSPPGREKLTPSVGGPAPSKLTFFTPAVGVSKYPTARAEPISPYATSSACGPYVNSEATVWSGRINARYPPSRDNTKFVCHWPVPPARFLPEQKTTR